MFINLSNHPSKKWDVKQIEEAALYGEIIDIPFPSISAEADEEAIKKTAQAYCEKISKYDHPVVMVQGEFTFTFCLVTLLKEKSIMAVAGCSERKTKERINEDGTQVKQTVFEFVRFREY